jgi:hypothetical protein
VAALQAHYMPAHCPGLEVSYQVRGML